PDASSVRPCNELAVAWMNLQVVYRHGGQNAARACCSAAAPTTASAAATRGREGSALEPRPGLAAVDRDEHAGVCADEQDVGIARALANHIDRILRQIAGNRRPRLPEVRRLPDERAE